MELKVIKGFLEESEKKKKEKENKIHLIHERLITIINMDLIDLMILKKLFFMVLNLLRK